LSLFKFKSLSNVLKSKNFLSLEVASYKTEICSSLFNSEIVFFTIYFSNVFLGLNKPGVSTKIIWQSGFSLSEFSILRIPLVANLVVWTFLETIETFWPSNLLIKVDLPAFGGPTKKINPDRVLIFNLHFF
tara:strand:- start:174 stop:566 length:393 start_codon:yes stop_codon:yes gene_type:complete